MIPSLIVRKGTKFKKYFSWGFFYEVEKQYVKFFLNK